MVHWYKSNKIDMRLSIEILEKIANDCGTLEVGTGNKQDQLSLRFGYWRKVDFTKLKEILPDHLTVEENLVNDDPECGELWNYNISHGV